MADRSSSLGKGPDSSLTNLDKKASSSEKRRMPKWLCCGNESLTYDKQLNEKNKTIQELTNHLNEHKKDLQRKNDTIQNLGNQLHEKDNIIRELKESLLQLRSEKEKAINRSGEVIDILVKRIDMEKLSNTINTNRIVHSNRDTLLFDRLSMIIKESEGNEKSKETLGLLLDLAKNKNIKIPDSIAEQVTKLGIEVGPLKSDDMIKNKKVPYSEL